MLEDSLKKIEAAIQNIKEADPEGKKELLSLLSELKGEIKRLSETHQEQAKSIAGLTELAAHEVTREERAPKLAEHSLLGLALSTEGFEASHPKLVRVVNALCEMLAKLGI